MSRLRGALRARARGDDGQVMLLSLAFGLLAILLVGVVVSATAVHLERKRLLALADLAALEAADAMDPGRYYAEPSGEPGAPVSLTPDEVAAAVEAYLADAPGASRFTDLEVLEAGTEDGRTVVVTLRAVADVPLLNAATAAWSDGVVLVVTAHARAD